MTQDEEHMRDLAAMFAMCGIIMRGNNQHLESVTDDAYRYADAFMESRSTNAKQGIAAIKRKKKNDATD